MAKSYISLGDEVIINYLEATLVANGRVNTSDVVRVFGINRVNAARLVKEWQGRSSLPIYDSSAKAFVAKTGENSAIFTDRAAVSYSTSVEQLYRKTLRLVDDWNAAKAD